MMAKIDVNGAQTVCAHGGTWKFGGRYRGRPGRLSLAQLANAQALAFENTTVFRPDSLAL